MKGTNYISHGDVDLHPVKGVPADAKLVGKGSFVLAEGETTGHRHVITETKKNTLKIYQTAEGMYLELSEPATITHEEHGVLTVQPGIYFQVQEREYDNFLHTTRKVVD